jgi:cytoskeletal protein CcmA (bactofilin family)
VRRPLVLAAALLALLVPATPAAASETVAEDDAVVVVNGDVVVDPTVVVEGVFVINGDVRVAGRVDGDVVIAAGDAVVRGRIDGDLVTIAGRARLLPKASVGGDLIYGDEAPLVAPAARVEGKIDKEDWSDSLGLIGFIGAFVFWLAMTISAAVLGVLLLLISPRAADATFAQAQSRFWTAVGIGALIFILVPIAIFVASITLLGLPLGIALGLGALPLAAIAYVTAAWALGRAIVKPPRDRILSFLAGLAILRLVALLPVLGVLVWLAAVIVGLGLLGGAIAAAREPAPARAPGS